jgi:hypothetical protein
MYNKVGDTILGPGLDIPQIRKEMLPVTKIIDS